MSPLLLISFSDGKSVRNLPVRPYVVNFVTFSTSWVPLHANPPNLPQLSSRGSEEVLYLEAIRNIRWLSWPTIGQDIFDFSRTACLVTRLSTNVSTGEDTLFQLYCGTGSQQKCSSRSIIFQSDSKSDLRRHFFAELLSTILLVPEMYSCKVIFQN